MWTVEPLTGRKVLVMGLGVHGGGVGVTRYLVRQGADVTVTDHAAPDMLESSLRKLDNLSIKFVLGSHRDEDFRGCDLIVRNPAVPDNSPYLAAARRRGIPIETEIGIFWKACPTRRMIAVTGTKGKTTTTCLIGEILRRAGLTTFVCGNLGVSGLEDLDVISPDSWVVLELSSFQLDSLALIRPRPPVAVLTSLYPDHLDRYESFDAYRMAKASLFQNQEASDLAVVDGASTNCRELAGRLRSQVRFFHPETLPEDWTLALLGKHNRALAGAALLATEAAGVAREIVREALASFTAVDGRLELVAEINGIRFYDDSAAGIPEATAAALHALDAPVIWIAGGRDRGLDYSTLAPHVQLKVRAAVLLPGSARDRIAASLPTMTAVSVSSLEEATVRASELAHSGDSVLFSPAAGQGLFTMDVAAIGSYRHEDDIRNRFHDAVKALKSSLSMGRDD